MADIKVQVCLFAFDCLYLNGEMLLQRPLTERRAALLEAVEEKPGELQYALYKVRPSCSKSSLLIEWWRECPDHLIEMRRKAAPIRGEPGLPQLWGYPRGCPVSLLSRLHAGQQL